MEITRAKRRGKITRVFSWVCIALLLISFIGLIVCILMAEGSPAGSQRAVVCWGVAFGCLGVIALSIAGALLLFRLGDKFAREEADARERAISDESFFIGEKMLATFEADCLRLHGESEADRLREVRVPYRDVRFFDVTLRRSPRDKGEKSVVLEIPARYTQAKAEKNAPPSLVSMERKERLFAAIEAHSLTLVQTDDNATLPPPERLFAVKLPNRKGSGKVISLVLGIALTVAGVLLAIFGGNASNVGYLLATFGVLVGGKGVIALARGGGAFVVYRDGVLWKEENRYEQNYLRWSEISGFSRVEHEKQPFVKFDCAYGSYYYPDIQNLYERLVEQFPEKKGEK